MKKKKNGKLFGNFYSPYWNNDSEMSAWFNSYISDPDRFIEINNQIFLKLYSNVNSIFMMIVLFLFHLNPVKN